MPSFNPPNRLLRNGRQVDPEFSPDERLYRCGDNDDVLDGIVLPPAVKFPDYSVNRSKYSNPDDVFLNDLAGDLVLAFTVADVPTELPPDENHGSPYKWTWRVEHDPLEENYAHSEVRTYRDGRHSKNLKPSNSAKKWFRHVLSQRMFVIEE